MGDFNEKGVENFLTTGYRMKEAIGAKELLKFEGNVICTSNATKYTLCKCLILVIYMRSNYNYIHFL